MFNIENMRLELTNKCNLNCEGCFAYANKRSKGNVILLDDIKKLIKTFKQNGGKNILITGGECTLSEDFEEVVTFSKSINLMVSIFTNGTILKEKEIKKYKKYIDTYFISIDGLRARHDMHRGVHGSFDKTINFINLLNKNKCNFVIETVVDNHNYDDIEWIKEIAIQMKVKKWIITPKYVEYKNTLTEVMEKKLLEHIEILTKKLNYRTCIQCNVLSKEQYLVNPDIINDYFCYYVLIDGRILPFFYLNDNSLVLNNVQDYAKNGIISINATNKLDKLYQQVLDKIKKRDFFDISELIYECIENIA